MDQLIMWAPAFGTLFLLRTSVYILQVHSKSFRKYPRYGKAK